MNCWNFWKLGVSRFHLQLDSLCPRKMRLKNHSSCSRPWPFRPRYADPPPLIRHWQLVLKFFR